MPGSPRPCSAGALHHVLLLGLALAGCTSDKPEDPTGDDDDDTPTPGECEADDACALLREICEDGACVPGDRDNTLENASPVLLGDENVVSGHIFPEGDLDWFVYEAPAPGWVSVRTVVADDLELDTVVTLYGPNGAPHAVMDNYPVWPYGVTGFDTVLYAYLSSAGSWYITVEDVTSYYDELVPTGKRTWKYDLLIRELNGTIEPDGPATPSLAIDVVDGDTINVLGVVVDDPGDVDYIDLSFPFDDGRLLEVWGQAGITGSSASPLVRLKEDGALLAEKVGVGDEGWLSWFRARSGDFQLEATDSEGRGAADAWFPLYVRTYNPGDNHPFFGTNTYEREVEPNDDVALALPLAADPEGTGADVYDAFRLDAEVSAAGDSDWWQVGADPGDVISVRCWTSTFGSLAELDVELYAGGAMFASGTEPDEDDFYIVDAVPPAGGAIDVRIVGAEAGPAHWYRCAVYVGP